MNADQPVHVHLTDAQVLQIDRKIAKGVKYLDVFHKGWANNVDFFADKPKPLLVQLTGQTQRRRQFLTLQFPTKETGITTPMTRSKAYSHGFLIDYSKYDKSLHDKLISIYLDRWKQHWRQRNRQCILTLSAPTEEQSKEFISRGRAA